MTHKAGFVGIVGKPNVGKSTLSNLLLGEKLSIVSNKAQTTRHRILGILNEEDYQIIFSDSPGVIKPAYKLHENMMHSVGEVFNDSELLLVMIATDDDEIPSELLTKIKKRKEPTFLLINKADLSNPLELKNLVEKYSKLNLFKHIFPISALQGLDRSNFVNELLKYLPEHPPYYPKDQLTDRPERFFVEEMIREGIFHFFRQEVPYATQVEVIEFKEEPKIIRIVATIFAERQSQKGILIGPGGSGIKRIGTHARKRCEAFFNKKVFLDLKVSVKKDWRKDDIQLKRFGYDNK